MRRIGPMSRRSHPTHPVPYPFPAGCTPRGRHGRLRGDAGGAGGGGHHDPGRDVRPRLADVPLGLARHEMDLGCFDYVVEQSHRTAGYLVGRRATAALAAGLWFVARWRLLLWPGAALLAVVAQGVLGGMAVSPGCAGGTAPETMHGLFAQVVFSLLVVLAACCRCASISGVEESMPAVVCGCPWFSWRRWSSCRSFGRWSSVTCTTRRGQCRTS